MSEDRYSFNVAWSDEDEGYVATCPEFPGVSAFGVTPEQALSEAAVALELAIETYKEEGWPLPEPRALPQHSGQFRVRLPKSLHALLVAQAEQEGVSLNTLVASYLAASAGAAASSAAPAGAGTLPVARQVAGKRASA